MRSQVLRDQASVSTSAWLGLLRGHAATTRDLNADLVATHGLTINDFEALLSIARADDGRLRRVDLAERLLLTASGVTRLLEGLERAGYVKKAACPTDARVTYAVLTDAGRAKLEEASCDHVAAITQLFESRFTSAELQQLAELLGRLGDGGDDVVCGDS